jgi:abl interactor 2
LPQPTLPKRQVHVEPEEEETHGEWAEALYDYSSTVSVIKFSRKASSFNYRVQEPGDLPLKADQRVLVTDKTSDDWYVFSHYDDQRPLKVCFFVSQVVRRS